MRNMRPHYSITLYFLFCLPGHNETWSIMVESANIPPHSSSFWGWRFRDDYLGAGDDVPIVGENNFNKKKKRRRRRRSKTTSESSDESDDGAPHFFYDQENNIDWRERYELDRMQRRRHRNNSRGTNDDEHGIVSPWNSFRQWTFTKTGIHIPPINFHFDPITILKIRKSWDNAIPGAIVRVGADFETQHRFGGGIWRLRGCLEDKFFGGRFTLKGRRDGDRGVIIEYSRSWLFAGAGSLATRFNLCAQYDTISNRGSARFGFRTENMNSVGTTSIVSSPTLFGGSRRQCFTIIPTLPLDGPNGQFKLEAKTRIELPEPEITLGVDLGGVSVDGGSVGMGIGGDIDMEIEELNVICQF